MTFVNIDVWSDIACPWCWIGKRHLDAALSDVALSDADIKLQTRWHAFELNPAAPRQVAGPVDYSARLASKYGMSKAEGQAMIDRMVAAGRAAGVNMRFDLVQPSNTFDAHRLLAWAGEVGASQHRLKERLFAAYLGEGRVMADHQTLIELASELGLDEGEAASVLGSDRYADAVRQDEQTAADLGIRGVPNFVINRRFKLNGAQPPEVIGQALAQAAAEPSDPVS